MATTIFAAEGDLDLTFDADGIVTTDNGGTNEGIVDIAVQPDGKIIAVGYSPENSSTPRTVVVRYNTNGSIDSTFGASGKVIIQQLFNPQALALQPNGKIVLVGSTGFFPNNDLYIARLNSDGSFDATFNGNGAVIMDLRGSSDGANSVKIQPDGKIVTGGTSGSPIQRDYAIVRFNADGSLDATFDGDGKVFTMIDPFSGQENFADLVIQPDGKIVGVGTAILGNADGSTIRDAFIAVRYNSNGSLDTTFDGDGKVFTRIGANEASVSSVALQTDGKIIVAGNGRTAGKSQIALVRYNADGSLDSSFGSAGKTLIPLTPFTASAIDIKVQADNKIVLAVTAGILAESYAAAARLSADGSPDASFSGDGSNIIFFPTYTPAAANAVAIQPNGKILIGGYVGASGAQDFLLARFDASSCNVNCSGANRRTAADFDGDGKSDISVFRPSNGYWYVSKSSGGYSFVQWGLSTDTPVPGDYDGDGKTDIAVYRESPGIAVNGFDNTWYILRSSDNTFYARQWGRSTSYERDAPEPADYDGDGRTDLAVYTRTDAVGGTGDFKILQSSTNTGITRQWGLNTDIRVPADYDGDSKADLAVVRNGVWYILQSSDGTVRIEYFGLSTDRFVPADYDGDGKADIAVWRPSNGTWYRINSADKSFVAYQFGLSGDRQVPADYDGDGRTDIAVFRPSTGVWYLQQSSKGFRAEQFGLSGDLPIPRPDRY